MIVLYGGRVVLERRSLVATWEATIKMPTQGKRLIDLDTFDINEAYIRAQYHYLALKKNLTFEQVKEQEQHQAKCWSCIYWQPRSSKCLFEFPEAKASHGRYAAKCEMYSDGKKSH